jgi:xylulose-5-phosphate/fructose-6-phosphate phosphoketolase
LLREPLRLEHLKPRPLGHWGTCAGLNLVYGALNGLVRRTYRPADPAGHGPGAWCARDPRQPTSGSTGTHAEYDPALSVDGNGLVKLVRWFSWPGGFPVTCSPRYPVSSSEGGELGYALATAFGAALDDRDLLVACVVGDGEAETARPRQTGMSQVSPVVLMARCCPILHLNGYKISSPTIYATMSDTELDAYFRGCGWSPRTVDVRHDEDPDAVTGKELDAARAELRSPEGPPMIILRSAKGAGARKTDPHGMPLAGTFHAHQVPLPHAADDPEELKLLGKWLRSYRPEELCDESGRPFEDLPDRIARYGGRRRHRGLRRDRPHASGTFQR